MRQKAGDLAGAVELSAKALAKPNAAFFVRNTALVLALEAAACDPVKVAHGLVGEAAIAALRQAVEALTPRKDRVWAVQSPGSVEDTMVHLGYSYLVLGAPDETLALVEEARHAGVLTPSLKRVALEAYRRLDRSDELVQLGREWLDDLEEEALILVAEYASGVGDVQLVEAVQALVTQKGYQQAEVPHLLRAMRWVALWRSGTRKQQALTEVKAADVANSDSLAVISGGARILHAGKDEVATDAAIEKACTLVSKDTAPAERLLLADLLFATDKLEFAARQYELLAPRGKHSELHNRLLRCYVRTGALRKAKELVLSFPVTWTSDERALSLAIERRINLSHRPAIGSARDRVPYPGHTYIIDATVGDVYLVSAFDRRRIIGRPVIYLVVDAFSSLIVSVHVALDGPNFAQARIAMCRAISDKSLWLAWLGLSKLGHLLPQGCVPTFWLADRGELHSQASRTLQTELRTNLSIAAAYRADWKSLVERLFGILNTMMIHWMPGAVVQRYRERGSPDNRLDAVLTLQEFTRMLVRKVAILNLTRDMSMHMSAALLSADVRPNPLGFFTHGIRYKHGSAVFLDHQSSMRKTLATSDATIGRHGVMMGKAQYAASWMLDHPVVQVAGFEGNSPVKCIVSPDDPLSAWCMLPNEQTMREVRLQRGLQRASHFCAEDIQEMDALRTFLGQDLKDDTTAERLTIERENRLEVENAKLQAQAAIRGAPVSKNSRIKGVRSNRQKEIDGTEPLDTQEQTATATATATASLPGAPRSPKNFSPSQEDLNERSSGKQDQDYFERLSAQLSSWEHS